jgi:hypothetical protein
VVAAFCCVVSETHRVILHINETGVRRDDCTAMV